MADQHALLAHTSWVRDLAVRLVRDPDLADDLAQQTYLAAIDHGGSQPIRAQRAWLGTVLRNLVRETARGQRRRRAREQRAARAEAMPSTLESVAERAARRDVVDAVMALPERYRAVVVARYFEGELPAEIARRGGEPVATIKTRLQRGLGLLREHLEAHHSADGGRGAWRAALLPLTGPALVGDPGGVATASSSVPAAAPAVGRWLFGAVAAMAVIAIGIGWASTFGEGAPPDPRPGRSAIARTASVDPEPGTARRRLAAPPVSESASVSVAATERVLDPRQRTIRGLVIDPQGRGVDGLLLSVGAADPGVGPAGPAGPGARGPDPRAGRSARAATAGGGLAVATSQSGGAFEFRNVTSYGAIEVASPSHAVVLTTRAVRSAARSAVVVVAPRRTVRGRVVDEAGNGLADAVVAIEYPAGLRASLELDLESVQTRDYAVFSDTNGAFDLVDVPLLADAHWLIRREGFEPHREPTQADGVRANWIVALTRAKPQGPTWRGEVVTASGWPVPDARVSDGVEVTRTDASGRFWLPWRDGATHLRAVTPGWQSGRVALGTDGAKPLVIELPGPALEIRGVVLDADEHPVPMAAVWLADPTVLCPARTSRERGTEWSGLQEGATTYFELPLVVENLQAGGAHQTWRRVPCDARGRFVLDGLDARAYAVVAESANGALSAEPTVLTAGALDAMIVLRPRRGSSVRGLLQDLSGQPVHGAQVSLQRSRFALRQGDDVLFRHLDLGHCVMTAVDGSFELFGLPGDGPWPEFALRIHGAGIRTTSMPIGASSGHSTKAAWRPGEVLRLPRWARVRVDLPTKRSEGAVRFTDAEGEPVPLQRREGNRRQILSEVRATGGRTGWFDVPAHAVNLKVLIDGQVVHEMPVRLVPQRDHRFRANF